MRLEVVAGVIIIPHLGITIRTMLAAGAQQNKLDGTRHRKWRISYRGVIIGHVRVANRGDDDEIHIRDTD